MSNQTAICQTAIWTFQDLRKQSPDDVSVKEWQRWMLHEARKLLLQCEIEASDFDLIKDEISSFHL